MYAHLNLVLNNETHNLNFWALRKHIRNTAVCCYVICHYVHAAVGLKFLSHLLLLLSSVSAILIFCDPCFLQLCDSSLRVKGGIVEFGSYPYTRVELFRLCYQEQILASCFVLFCLICLDFETWDKCPWSISKLRSIFWHPNLLISLDFEVYAVNRQLQTIKI